MTEKLCLRLSLFIHFWSVFPFYTPWKHQETFGFLIFSGGIKWEHCPEMGQDIASNLNFFESSPNKLIVI